MPPTEPINPFKGLFGDSPRVIRSLKWDLYLRSNQWHTPFGVFGTFLALCSIPLLFLGPGGVEEKYRSQEHYLTPVQRALQSSLDRQTGVTQLVAEHKRLY